MKQDHTEHMPIRRTWLFQANPDKYDIFETMKQGTDLWNLRQHSSSIQVGDRVLIWVCGEKAGIYGLGTVMTPPAIIPDSPDGISHWRDPIEGKRPKPRVLVRYDKIMLDRPLKKAYIQSDPNLWNMQILRSPRGTNFPVTEKEWRAIEGWLEDTPSATPDIK